MKWIALLIVFSFGLTATAQKSLNPRKSNKMFGGAQSFKDYHLYGLQFQLGGTFLMNRLNNPQNTAEVSTHNFRGNYTFDPKGRLGAYAEIGMFHFPKKFPKLKISKEKSIVLLSYVDWGLGFKYFRGAEDLNVNFVDQGGVTTSSDEQTYSMTNGHVYGRFSAHKNVYIKPKKREKKLNFFLDNSLGINVDYRVMQTSDPYALYAITDDQLYSKPLQIQLHYGLGFGFSPKRGTFIIPGVRIPILGYQSMATTVGGNDKGNTSFGKPSMHWFSSRYWPLLFNVKFMFSLEKKPKGCATGITNDQDRNTQQGR
jgi:hypothetical protein